MSPRVSAELRARPRDGPEDDGVNDVSLRLLVGVWVYAGGVGCPHENHVSSQVPWKEVISVNDGELKSWMCSLNAVIHARCFIRATL